MSREKQKLTRAERIVQHKEDLIMLKKKKDEGIKSLAVDKKRVELTEKVNELKVNFPNVTKEGRPEYMAKQEFWSLTNELELLHYNNITKPQMDMVISRANDDIKGLDAAIEYTEKELVKEEDKQ